jgi:hypothetical protein
MPVPDVFRMAVDVSREALAGRVDGSRADVMVRASGRSVQLGFPRKAYQAADWLRARHRWVDQLAGRVAGDGENWLDELAGAVADCVDHAPAWREYEVRHREPLDENAHETWLNAGPSKSARGAAFAVMSAGEQRVVRLVATLCLETRVPWSVADIGSDERGAAVPQDWLQIVHGQLPDRVKLLYRRPVHCAHSGIHEVYRLAATIESWRAELLVHDAAG